MRTTKALLAATLVATGTISTACGSTAHGSDTKTLTVLAASSLTGTYTELAKDFEAAHPGVTVRLVFDSSATLAQKAVDQAPGDVLATADQKTMDQARTGKGVTGTPREFATNVVTLAVPRKNPGHVHRFADLQHPSVDYLTCVPTAPCGSAAQALLDKAHITHRPVSQEVDVKSVLAKVVADEADAGLVYRSDVTAAGSQVTGLPVPGAAASPNTYWVAVTSGAKQSALARAWIALLTGAKGRQVLTKAGFGTP